MVSVFDVAKYILVQCGPMSAMKLQKLVYYSKAWSLVWDGDRLFSNRVEAWANGPVVRELYAKHRKQFEVSARDFSGDGDARKIRGETKKTIDAVIAFYGDKSPHFLSELTHLEKPWKDARVGLAPGERSQREITNGAMLNYYGNLS